MLLRYFSVNLLYSVIEYESFFLKEEDIKKTAKNYLTSSPRQEKKKIKQIHFIAFSIYISQSGWQ